MQHSEPVNMLTRLGSPPARWVYVVAWMIVIFLASADASSGSHSSAIVDAVIGMLGIEPTPGQLEVANHLMRKAAHFTEYGILGLLWAWALPATSHRLILAWAAATLYAGTDEFHQLFVASRGPAIADVGIDSAGAATALTLAWLLARRPLTKHRN